MKPKENVLLVKGPYNQTYVLKKIVNSQYLHAKREICIHGAVNTVAPKLAPILREHFTDESHVNIIMDYCSNGNLLKYSGASESLVQSKVKGALSALKALHSLGIVHNDVKPNNFAIDVNDNIRLIDFGGSFVQDAVYFSFDCTPVPLMYGTPMYMSPERLSGNPCYKSDVWAVGVMCYYLLTKRFPFDDKYNRVRPNVVHIWRSILEDGLPAYSPEIVSENAHKFMAALLCKDVKDRPSAAEALDLAWMKEV